MTALESLSAAFADSFMKPQITHESFYRVETSDGTETVPFDAAGAVLCNADLQAYCEGDVDEPGDRPTLQTAFLARLSAPGYMDCTDWASFESAEEAAQYLLDTYADEFAG
jgi:hypothetical protein